MAGRIYHTLAHAAPGLKKKLRMARLEKTPEDYVKEKFIFAVMAAAAIGFLAFVFLSQRNPGMLWLAIPITLIGWFFVYQVMMRQVDAIITKRAKEVDREILYAGRFLLVKLNSGTPLISALIDASNSFGVASKYFKEIVQDIELGTPIEQAIYSAAELTVSRRFRKILFQIANALRIGIDVTAFLSSILDEIADEELIEIQRYGKKLSSFTMFYMLGAVVVPSLGMTMGAIVLGLLNKPVGWPIFVAATVLIVFVQVVFMGLFKSIRPNVNI
ncbi:MAG: type II secretion system F family protein [Candidatus Woesearchaeota archaeon]|nr:MAG: type II secretion system F family protein [Candidatus Woesearchaeota archaeon]